MVFKWFAENKLISITESEWKRKKYHRKKERKLDKEKIMKGSVLVLFKEGRGKKACLNFEFQGNDFQQEKRRGEEKRREERSREEMSWEENQGG